MPVRQAAGMIETMGFVGAIEAADAAAKVAQVEIVSRQKADAGLVTIFIRGDVASVRSSVDAGAAAARRVGQLISAHVIPSPADGLEELIMQQPAVSKSKKAKK